MIGAFSFSTEHFFYFQKFQTYNFQSFKSKPLGDLRKIEVRGKAEMRDEDY